MNITTLGLTLSNFTEVYPKILDSDFCTSKPTYSSAQRIAGDIRWEENMKRVALNNTKFKKEGKN